MILFERLKNQITSVTFVNLIGSFLLRIFVSLDRRASLSMLYRMPAKLSAVGLEIDFHWIVQIDGLVQDCCISSAAAREILQSCTKPVRLSIRDWCSVHVPYLMNSMAQCMTDVSRTLVTEIPQCCTKSHQFEYSRRNCLKFKVHSVALHFALCLWELFL